MKVLSSAVVFMLAVCGASGAVLRATDVDVDAKAKYAYVGCYKDASGASLFSEKKQTANNMTPEACYEICKDFSFFGVKGTSCGCRNKFTNADGGQFGTSNLCKKCSAAGWGAYECGGTGMNSVYAIAQAVASSSSGTSSRRRRSFL